MTLARKPETALSKYDPVKGILKIHGAREAEKRARRWRDFEALNKAIENKLTEQGEFVNWWDTEAERPQHGQGPGRGHKKRDCKNAISFLKPEDFGLTIPMLSRWRRRLGDLVTRRQTVVAEQTRAWRRIVRATVPTEQRRQELREDLERIAALEAVMPTGLFDVIVVDPPWPMEKIERDEERPDQMRFDYPTMDEAALRAITLPMADDCHIWLWTTQRFLPLAFSLLDEWALSYVCTFVWHKPGGFQPVGLPQYNCEFALYARRGTPLLLETKALPTCFEAPRGKHSEKPEAFYAMVRRVTAGRRLDMYNRRQIEGFKGAGKEAIA